MKGISEYKAESLVGDKKKRRTLSQGLIGTFRTGGFLACESEGGCAARVGGVEVPFCTLAFMVLYQEEKHFVRQGCS